MFPDKRRSSYTPGISNNQRIRPTNHPRHRQQRKIDDAEQRRLIGRVPRVDVAPRATSSGI